MTAPPIPPHSALGIPSLTGHPTRFAPFRILKSLLGVIVLLLLGKDKVFIAILTSDGLVRHEKYTSLLVKNNAVGSAITTYGVTKNRKMSESLRFAYD